MNEFNFQVIFSCDFVVFFFQKDKQTEIVLHFKDNNFKINTYLEINLKKKKNYFYSYKYSIVLHRKKRSVFYFKKRKKKRKLFLSLNV